MTRITQVDIARKLGISQATVTAALNHDSKIALRSETRERVLATARKLGYRPNRYAQIMRKGRSGIIGIIQSVGAMQAAVERAFFMAKTIHEAGYQTLAADLLWYREGLRNACDAMLDAEVEGVLLAGLSGDYYPAEIKRLREARIPVVALGGGHFLSTPQVCSDYQQGMFDLTQHLLGLGYRRLTLLAPPAAGDPDRKRNWGFTERAAGFRKAVQQAGLNSRQAGIVYQDNSDASDYFCAGKLGMQRILERTPRPEVVLCSNDHWAIAAMQACAEAGLRVPEDLAITGFDNTTDGLYAQVPLTTVAQPNEALGRKAAEILIRVVRGERLAPNERFVKLPCQLIVRKSCGATRKN